MWDNFLLKPVPDMYSVWGFNIFQDLPRTLVSSPYSFNCRVDLSPKLTLLPSSTLSIPTNLSEENKL